MVPTGSLEAGPLDASSLEADPLESGECSLDDASGELEKESRGQNVV